MKNLRLPNRDPSLALRMTDQVAPSFFHAEWRACAIGLLRMTKAIALGVAWGSDNTLLGAMGDTEDGWAAGRSSNLASTPFLAQQKSPVRRDRALVPKVGVEPTWA